VRKVNGDLIEALNNPDTRKRLATFGRENLPMSPAETLAFIQGEQQMWAPILAQIGRTPQ
jgi:tripartite-type tricarboxylate transporter receptor subunit TctC